MRHVKLDLVRKCVPIGCICRKKIESEFTIHTEPTKKNRNCKQPTHRKFNFLVL
jgi:hypothetical protein